MATPNSIFTSGQILTAAQMNNLPLGIVSGIRSTVADSTPPTSAPVSFVSTPNFTPVVNRIYRVTWAIGYFIKHLSSNNQEIKIRVGSTSGTLIDSVVYSAVPTGYWGSPAKTTYVTTAQLGTTSSTYLVMTVENNGSNSAAQFSSGTDAPTILMIEDIGTTV